MPMSSRPPADDVGHRRFAGKLDRMPERRDHRAGAEPDRAGLAREIGDVDERIGRDGEVHAVMLAGPGRLEACLLRQSGPDPPVRRTSSECGFARSERSIWTKSENFIVHHLRPVELGRRGPGERPDLAFDIVADIDAECILRALADIAAQHRANRTDRRSCQIGDMRRCRTSRAGDHWDGGS